MNKKWLLSILGVSFCLLAVLKTHENRSLSPFYKAEKSLRLASFEKAREKVNKSDLDLLKLWESMITGRSAPLSKVMKEKYKTLALNHIFTPSGFHLSAVLVPFMKLVKSPNAQLFFLLVVGCSLLCLPGFGALKRMVLIKGGQKIMGLHLGFVIGLLSDVFFGTFQNGALSFTYSFLFLGIIYSGLSGPGLIIWFFLAQMLLAYFQGNDISFLLMLFSPLLNIIFALLMPLLFLLSFPLTDWQLECGIFLLKVVQAIVDVCARISLNFPSLEVHLVTIIIAFLFLYRQKSWLLGSIFLFTTSLNLEHEKNPTQGKYEWIPHGPHQKTIFRDTDIRIIFNDGSCRLKLVRGLWWESCSPSRRSSQIAKL
jgi:hypothetical protein